MGTCRQASSRFHRTGSGRAETDLTLHLCHRAEAVAFPAKGNPGALSLKFAQQIRLVPDGRNVYSTEIPKNCEAPEERNIGFE